MRERVLFLASLLFTLMIILLVSNTPSYTGYATFATSDEARAVIDIIAADNSLQLLGEGAQICIAVEISNETAYYYRLAKTAGSVDTAEIYCADPGQDNIIVKLNSYDDLLSVRSDPKAFAMEKKNTGYYIFPSNYVQAGGELQCTEAFQQNYCAPFYYYLTKSDLAGMDLACCANYDLTAEQKAKIDQLKTGKPKETLFPAEFLFSTTGVISAIAVIIAIVIVVSLLVTKPKNPLIDYVKSTRSQGYADEDIKNTLLGSGWDEKTIDGALKIK